MPAQKAQAIKSPAGQGETGGAGERDLGRSRRSGITPGEGEISDRPCICRELYDHPAHGQFVKIHVNKTLDSGGIHRADERSTTLIGLGLQAGVDALVRSQDARIKYVIWNRHIISSQVVALGMSSICRH